MIEYDSMNYTRNLAPSDTVNKSKGHVHGKFNDATSSQL